MMRCNETSEVRPVLTSGHVERPTYRVAGRVFGDEYLDARIYAYEKAVEFGIWIPIEIIEVTAEGANWKVLRYITPEAAPRAASCVREIPAGGQRELVEVVNV